MPKRMNSVRKRTYIIIGALVIIGASSLIARIIIKEDYGVSDALLDLGYEGLPAAILFLLIDGAIHQYEERQEVRLRAMRALKGGGANTATDLLDDLSEGNTIRLGNLQGSTLENVNFKERILCEGDLDRSDIDALELSSCTLKAVSFRRSLVRLAVLEGCKFLDVHFDDADLTGSLFVSCHFDENTTFHRAALSDTRFKQCAFAPNVVDTMNPAGARFLCCEGIAPEVKQKLLSGGAVVELG